MTGSTNRFTKPKKDFHPTMKQHVILIMLFALCSSAAAQTFKGKVEDEFGVPIERADVMNMDNSNHSHTDAEGVFELAETKIGDNLVISHSSYETMVFVVESMKSMATIRLRKVSISLDEVVIGNKVNALRILADVDIQKNPVNSSQEILQKVPGLFIGQHAGGGKAEQIFLRGFDIDHGTDINLTVDGLPVNIVSHAHGQGYADLHFVIPETLQRIDFGKGPYNEAKGNFATAGYVDFQTKNRLDRSSIKMEVGQFDTGRLMGMFNLLSSDLHNAYLATEYIATDGPFDSPQNFDRINLFGKYSGMIDRDRIGATISYFESTWDASGQIPTRAVEDGSIGRFGAIDDTEGGTTGRTNVQLEYDKFVNRNATLKNMVYYSQYDFELYSNFTFFLIDPVNGDQIRQREERSIFGLRSDYEQTFSLDSMDGSWQAGIELRNDRSQDNELSRTRDRRVTLERIQFGDVNETNFGAYVGAKFNLGNWTLNPSVRVDYFDFKYNDFLQADYETQSNNETIVSPKLNVLYSFSNDLQAYVKTGKGFHSNDTRVVLGQEAEDILPAAYGFDVGYIWKPTPKMFLNMAYWYLYLEQEFVYVGDAGIVEPSGKTQRQGFDLSYRYQILPSLYWNLDLNYTYARAIDEETGQDYIPLAPDWTLVSGLNFESTLGFYGSANVRFLDDRPANEDNSIVAEGYTVVDLNLGYKWRRFDFGIQIQNLFDTEWNETQFATESRLQNETEPVEEIHFTPGTPFFLKGLVQYNF